MLNLFFYYSQHLKKCSFDSKKNCLITHCKNISNLKNKYPACIYFCFLTQFVSNRFYAKQLKQLFKRLLKQN